MKPLILHEDAEDELRAAIAFHEDRREGLGRKLRLAIEVAFQRIAADPLHFAKYEETEIRACPVKRFPYVVYFRERADCVWVATVSHQKRRPGYWSRRKPKPSI